MRSTTPGRAAAAAKTVRPSAHGGHAHPRAPAASRPAPPRLVPGAATPAPTVKTPGSGRPLVRLSPSLVRCGLLARLALAAALSAILWAAIAAVTS